ncbi:hypothetical protein REPUB_Repub13aG0174100 [Reevesia pubescens]
MSFLSTKEVAQTNLLSKKWKDHLRPSFPILKFNQLDFLGKDLPHLCLETHFRHSPKKFTNSIKDFSEFIDTTLDHFCKMKLRMLKFKLLIGVTSDSASWSCLVDKWIRLAVENQVRNLHLHLIFQDGPYPLPETVFLAKSITVLKLNRCKLDHPHSSNAFRFHSLTKLELVEVSLDELMIQKLTSNSPLLEDITLRHCWGFAYCRVPKLQKLRTFDISSHSEDLKSIEITAPNLRKCYLHCYQLERQLYKINLTECHDLRNLCLSGHNLIADKEFHDLMSKLPMLEELTVAFSKILRSVTISSQRLKHLEFMECVEIESIHIDTPNLLYFFFENSERIPNASINAPCSWEISFNPLREVDTLWYLKLKKFLGTSDLIKWLSIDIEIDEHSFDGQEFRKRSPSAPCEILDLHLGVQKLPESEYAALMDAYFSICYPKTLSVNTYSARDHETIKFYVWLYETLAKRDVYSCSCSNVIVKCWRHYLKDVKVKSFEGYGVNLEGDPLMNAWSNLPKGVVRFDLQWSFDVEKA